ncbi:MAG: ACT domain-containing protein, partial [Beijerinckiaceae bacterium]|nr:ACT domain-containing protein [Beijerinckiaceae bacterium]
DLPVKFAPNGGAVPGDRIVGIVTPGEGITIYPIQAPALKDFEEEPERWVDVRWDIDEESKSRFPAQILVSVSNEPGAFAEIAKVFGDADANIDGMSVTKTSPDYREIIFDVEVWNLKQLTVIISELKSKRLVNHVERVNG